MVSTGVGFRPGSPYFHFVNDLIYQQITSGEIEAVSEGYRPTIRLGKRCCPDVLYHGLKFSLYYLLCLPPPYLSFLLADQYLPE